VTIYYVEEFAWGHLPQLLRLTLKKETEQYYFLLRGSGYRRLRKNHPGVFTDYRLALAEYVKRLKACQAEHETYVKECKAALNKAKKEKP
jgi:hypothetical protein